jgi:hypothetical protein
VKNACMCYKCMFVYSFVHIVLSFNFMCTHMYKTSHDRTGVCKIIVIERPVQTVFFQRCRLLLVVNVKKKHTQCKYATLYGYETVARWANILHTPVIFAMYVLSMVYLVYVWLHIVLHGYCMYALLYIWLHIILHGYCLITYNLTWLLFDYI